MYEIDGSRGHVVNTNGEDGMAGNSAAFISQNFGDNPLMVYEFQTEEDENLGFAAIYENLDEGSRARISKNRAQTMEGPATAVFVFNPEEPNQYDIKVE